MIPILPPIISIKAFVFTIISVFMLSFAFGVATVYGPVKSNYDKKITDLEYQISDMEDELKRCNDE